MNINWGAVSNTIAFTVVFLLPFVILWSIYASWLLGIPFEQFYPTIIISMLAPLYHYVVERLHIFG